MREIRLSEIKLLDEAGVLSGATLYGHQDRFLPTFHVGTEDMLLIAKAGNPRTFRDLTRAAQTLYDVGVRKAVLDTAQYNASDADLTPDCHPEETAPF